MRNIAKFLMYLLLITICVLVLIKAFELIYYSDMPAWLKYILLK